MIFPISGRQSVRQTEGGRRGESKSGLMIFSRHWEAYYEVVYKVIQSVAVEIDDVKLLIYVLPPGGWVLQLHCCPIGTWNFQLWCRQNISHKLHTGSPRILHESVPSTVSVLYSRTLLFLLLNSTSSKLKTLCTVWKVAFCSQQDSKVSQEQSNNLYFYVFNQMPMPRPSLL